MTNPFSADQDIVRRINKSLVLNTLRLHAPISRAEVAKITGLNRSTISNIVASLIEDGLVYEQETKASPIGRPSISISLKPDGGAVIGVEIGVDFISVLLTDFIAQPIWQQSITSNPLKSKFEILAAAEELIDQAIAESDQRQLRLLGIGVGLPGLVNVKQGELIFAPNLKWKDLPLRQMWNQHFHLPVFLENEANLSALGEYYFGTAKHIDNFIYLSSGIGLGAGIIIGGKLFRGGHGYAGEIGHIQRDPNGDRCGCGRIGCWETQVGPQPVLQKIRKTWSEQPNLALPSDVSANLENLTFQNAVDAALNGNDVCLRAFQEVAGHLASGITDLVNVFNPELVVIGGTLGQAREILEPVIKETIRVEGLTPSANQVQIAFSARGKDACVYGAIAIVLDDIVRELSII
jgi:glucokinase-like ROK family protein